MVYMIVTIVDDGVGAVLIDGRMLLVSSVVVLCSRSGAAVVVVLTGHNGRAVATLSVAPSLS